MMMMMNVDQVSEGPFQQVFIPYGFVAAPPEFCEGMYVPHSRGYEATWPQGGHRLPLQQKWQGRPQRNYGAPRHPKAFVPHGSGSAPMWPQADFGPQEPVSVELSNLPTMLCNRMCLEAAIEQAGLENDVKSLELKSGTRGEAVLLLSSRQAAHRCIQHFNGLQWAKSLQPVSACYASQQPQQQQHEPESSEQQQQREPESSETDTSSDTIDKASGPVKDFAVTPCTVTPQSTPKLSPKSSICSSPSISAASPMVSPSMKPRWADLDSDDDDDEIVSQSTREGKWDSVLGSSGSGDASNSEQDDDGPHH